MDFVEAFLNVLAILGIIIAGGFIIFFLGDVLVSALDSKTPKPKKEKIKQKSEIYVHEANNAKKQNKECLFSNEDDLSVDDKDEGTITEFIPDEEPITEKPSSEYEQFNGFNDFFDFNKTNNEPRNLSVIDSEVKALAEEARESQALDDNQEKSFDELNDLFNEKDVNFGDDFDFNFDDISHDENANMESIYEEIMSKNKEVADAGFNVSNNIIEGTVKQPEFEIKEINQLQSKFIEGQAYNYEEPTVSKDRTKDYEATYDILNISRDNIKKNLDFETLNESKLKQEVQQLKQDLYEQKLEYEKIKSDSEQNESKLKIELNELQELYTQAEKQEAEKETKPTAILSKEEYEKRLETLKARLKANEKELRINKREFVPLRRVRKNLDSDKKKLRRREALVAKQKVMLYGVNNMASIDEEKANKLAEDLDLLDGLKISVKHCEEVMEANKERYPILETTHRILTTVIKDLKEDIAECEAKIKMYEESDETNDDGNTKKESIVLETNSVNVEHEQEPINKDEIAIETKEQDINGINEIKVEAEETMEAVNEVETKDIEKTKEEQSILNGSATDIVADLDELTEILSVNNDANKKANKKPKI
ncbi:MAG: hypothetical protein PHI76_03665 [Clostridia bacterium]|nr:hypothetical protein [Clostridia bacterium]